MKINLKFSSIREENLCETVEFVANRMDCTHFNGIQIGRIYSYTDENENINLHEEN